MHPLLQVLLSQPGLLGEHARGYAGLLVSDATAFKQASQCRLVWAVATACLALAGAVLVGVAVMLWAALPGMPATAAWALLATPCVPLAAALGCVLRLQTLTQVTAFANIQQQIQADMQLLQDIRTP